MRDEDLREVRYDWYCLRCKYWSLDDNEDPCSSCMSEPTRQGSYKPFYFKEEKTK